MSPRVQTLLNILALTVVIVAFAILVRFGTRPAPPTDAEPQIAAPSQLTGTPSPVATSSPATSSKVAAVPRPKVSAVISAKKQSTASPHAIPAVASTSTNVATRIENPYPNPPESSDVVNAAARAALVNILCRSNGSIRPISGSGVIIDPRGVILTNAHVAQYVLLSENPAINISCTIRTGSPARAAWAASVLYMPPMWVAAHVAELNTTQATAGTGEHDYALLAITGAIDSTIPLPPGGFPSLPFDARERIGFTGDQVLVASYPAEFLGGSAAESSLYAVSSLGQIGTLLTFAKGTVDVISLGGLIGAQSGSSGGAVVNPWGQLIGLITTTSEGATTAERDLHALTLAYISRDFAAQTGTDLSLYLQTNLAARLADFNANLLPGLMTQYMTRIKPAQQ